MRPKGHRKVHEVPKNAKTAQMHPKYLTGPKLASSDQSTESVQSAEKRPNCPEVPKLNNFYQEFSFGTPCVCTVVSYDYEFSLIHRVIRATLWFHD